MTQENTENCTIIFDLDGTLTDPVVGITRSIQHALERIGIAVPDADELLWCIGPPLQEVFLRLVGAERVPEAIKFFRERFSSIGLTQIRCIEQRDQSAHGHHDR